MNDWVLGALGISGSLLVAVLIAWAGGSYSAIAGGWPVFVLCGVFAYLVQWVMFVHAWVKKTEHYYDLTGSATYIVMVVSGVTSLTSTSLSF